MNVNIFKKEICSYCKYNPKCPKDKIEHKKQNKIVYKNEYKKEFFTEYTLDKEIKILKCSDYQKK